MRPIILILIVMLCFTACQKDENVLEAKFQEMVEHLDLKCPDKISENFFKAEINGIETCYFDGVDGLKMKIGYANTFTTSGSTFDTEAVIEDIGHKLIFGIIRDSAIQYQNWIEFRSPKFAFNISKEEYLDSLFSISHHKIIDRNQKEGISVRLNMMDKIKNMPGDGGNVYGFYTETGYQSDNSYVYFRKAEKIIDHGKIYYDIEMEVQCDLYYFKDKYGNAQYGKEGIWGTLKDGLLKMKIEL